MNSTRGQRYYPQVAIEVLIEKQRVDTHPSSIAKVPDNGAKLKSTKKKGSRTLKHTLQIF